MKTLYKLISIIVAITFTANGIAVAEPNQALTARDSSIKPVSNIYIPEQYGRIEQCQSIKVSEYQSAKQPMVVLIKDAHCNYEAQTNIAKILETLIRDYKIDLVCVEAAMGFVDTSVFGKQPDQQIRERTADKYTKKGYLSASEALSLTKGNNLPFSIYGVEDAKLYLENFKEFRNTIGHKEETGRYVEIVSNLVSQLKSKLYNKELLDFDKKAVEYADNKLSLTEWVECLSARLKAKNVKLKRNFDLVLKSIKLEEKMNFKKVERERAEIIKQLEKKVTKEDLKQLIEESLLFKIGKISSLEYYAYIDQCIKAYSLQSKAYNLNKYIHLLKLQSKINNDGLFDEIEEIETEIKEGLYKNEIERKLDKIAKNIRILNKLYNLSLTRKELADYKNNKSAFLPSEMLPFVAIQAQTNNITVPPELNDKDFISKTEQFLQPAEYFYEKALERDTALVNNLLKRMRDNDKNNAVLVVGGFHAQGIAGKLKEQGINYIVITPRITKEQIDCPYMELMMDKKIDIDKVIAELGLQNLGVPVTTDRMGQDLVPDRLNRILDDLRERVKRAEDPEAIRKAVLGALKVNSVEELEQQYLDEQNDVRASTLFEILKFLNRNNIAELSARRGHAVEHGPLATGKPILAITPESKELRELFDLVNSLKLSPELSEQIINVLREQDKKTKQIAFLPPDADHILRALKNVNELMVNAGINEAMVKAFGSEEKVLKVAQVALLLSKIGFGHEKLKPEDRTTYSKNRIFAMDLLKTVEDMLVRDLNLTPKQYQLIREAILREGTFGIGTERKFEDFQRQMKANNISTADMSPEKYQNPLTALLTIASEADISEARLQDWQKEPLLIRALSRVYSHPAIVSLYAERNDLEIQKARVITDKNITERKRFKRISGIDRRIAKQGVIFNKKLKEVIKKEVLEDPKIRALRVYRQIDEYVGAIDSESYLWYAGSFHISETRIENGRIIIVSHLDKSAIIGAAANLPHVVYYHSNRLEGIINQVNQGLGLKAKDALELEREKTRTNNDKYNTTLEAPKVELHAHLAMSVDFDILWNGILFLLMNGQMDKEENKKKYKKMLDKAQKSLTGMGIEGVDLEKIFGMAKQTAEQLMSFLMEYGSVEIKERLKKGPPENIDYLAGDAYDLLNGNIKSIEPLKPIPPEIQATIRKQIYQYDMLKHHIRHVFNYQEGALTKFVQHFDMVSKTLNILEGDKLKVMGRLTKNLLNNYSDDNVVYVETRFNIGTADSTLKEILCVIKAHKEWVEAHKGEKVTTPELKIILSITKFPNQKDIRSEKDLEEVIAQKQVSAKIFIDILKYARENIGNDAYYAKDGIEGVTPMDILEYVCGIDAAGQEEYNPPKLFKDAYALIRAYNETVPESEKIILTHHVAESVSDVSIESGIRYSVEAIIMLGMNRLGHNIIPALPDFEQFREKTMTERLSERIDQIKFDLDLLEKGVPLLSVTEQGLREELKKLEGKDPNYLVTYNYDTNDKIQDLETRARYALDLAISKGVIIETNPTSNLGISPHLAGYEAHTLKTYLSYNYGQYFRDLQDRRALTDKQREWIEKHLTEYTGPKKAKVIISTDDLTLFDTTVTKEIYRIAEAQGLSQEEVFNIIENSYEYAARLSDAAKKEMKAKIAEMRRRYEAQHADIARGKIKNDLTKTADGLTGSDELRNALTTAIETLDDIENGGWASKGYTMAGEVKWHGYTHAGNNTLETIKAMQNMQRQGITITPEAILLTAVAGMYHDVGYYKSDETFGTIKVDHEKRSMKFVVENAEQLGLKTPRDVALVCLIIAGTQAGILPKDWDAMEEMVRKGQLAELKNKIGGLEGIKDLLEDTTLKDKLDFTFTEADSDLLLGIIQGARTLASLDIYDTREDAVQMMFNLRKEFERDAALLDNYAGEDANMAKAKKERGKIALASTDTGQVGGTHGFYQFYADGRVVGFGVWGFVDKETRRRMYTTKAIVKETADTKPNALSSDDITAKRADIPNRVSSTASEVVNLAEGKEFGVKVEKEKIEDTLLQALSSDRKVELADILENVPPQLTVQQVIALGDKISGLEPLNNLLGRNALQKGGDMVISILGEIIAEEGGKIEEKENPEQAFRRLLTERLGVIEAESMSVFELIEKLFHVLEYDPALGITRIDSNYYNFIHELAKAVGLDEEALLRVCGRGALLYQIGLAAGDKKEQVLDFVKKRLPGKQLPEMLDKKQLGDILLAKVEGEIPDENITKILDQFLKTKGALDQKLKNIKNLTESIQNKKGIQVEDSLDSPFYNLAKRLESYASIKSKGILAKGDAVSDEAKRIERSAEFPYAPVVAGSPAQAGTEQVGRFSEAGVVAKYFEGFGEKIPHIKHISCIPAEAVFPNLETVLGMIARQVGTGNIKLPVDYFAGLRSFINNNPDVTVSLQTADKEISPISIQYGEGKQILIKSYKDLVSWLIEQAELPSDRVIVEGKIVSVAQLNGRLKDLETKYGVKAENVSFTIDSDLSADPDFGQMKENIKFNRIKAFYVEPNALKESLPALLVLNSMAATNNMFGSEGNLLPLIRETLEALGITSTGDVFITITLIRTAEILKGYQLRHVTVDIAA